MNSTVKPFTAGDISTWQANERTYYRISASRDELIDAPMWFHLCGLQETRTGYGRKLNSGLKILFHGKQYRLYVTCFGNAGTMWFTYRGQRIIVG